MEFSESNNYYDILDIPPNATSTEVREAYLRAKSAYNKDSVALYSLIDAGEREDILIRIEQAYEILSSEEKRRNYDLHHGIIETHSKPISPIVSIDRVPPMESFGMNDSEDLLVAPSTDFEFGNSNKAPAPAPMAQPPLFNTASQTSPVVPQSQPLEQIPTQPQSFESALAGSSAQALSPKDIAENLRKEILFETDWRGSFIRHIREAKNISIEEMSNITKVSKTYLRAIEEENFPKLPAIVFLRGFIVQIARILGLPQDKLVESYLNRYKAAKPEH